jgi:galactokinase
VADKVVVPYTCTAGGFAARVTLIGGGGSTVKLTVPVFVESLFDVAATETCNVVAPVGNDEGVV